MLEILQAQTGPIEALGITPFIAVVREEHHPDWRQRHTEPEALPENATRMQAEAFTVCANKP